MLQFHLLSGSFNNINTQALVYPLLSTRRFLRSTGINLKVFDSATKSSLVECDVLGLDSKYFKEHITNDKLSTLKLIENLRNQVPHTIWFNTSDGTGSIHREVLDVVSLYLKGQLLRDRDLYQEPLYGGRVYTNYFNKSFNIEDGMPISSEVLSSSQIAKLRISWNLGLAPTFSYARNLARAILLQGNCLEHLHLIDPIPRTLPTVEPIADNQLRICARMSLNHPRETIRYHRHLTHNALQKISVDTTAVSKHKYFRELRKSDVTVSPFGWGEVCIRDFEAFLAGSVVVKPDVEHIDTFPEIYNPWETYVPVRWDLSDLLDKISDLQKRPELVTRIKSTAFSRFQTCLGQDGSKIIANRIKRLLTELVKDS